MNPAEVLVQGILKPDGTLELDEKVSLAPGWVQVTGRMRHIEPIQAEAEEFRKRPGQGL